MTFREFTRTRRAWLAAALPMAALLAGLLFRLPSRPIPSASAAAADMDGFFKNAGVVQIPRIPPPLDFALADPNGNRHRLSDFRGKVVMVNFWTTWCPDCRVEMPDMEKLHQRFKNLGFVLLAVDLRESPKTVQNFFENHKLSFTALLDSDGQVGRRFGIRSIPTTYIIDQDGAMVGKAIGSRKWYSSAAVALFEQLINNPPHGRTVIGEQIKK